MKKILTLMVAGLALGLAACGSSSDKKEAKDDGKVDKSEQLVIYSNSASDGRKEWLTEEAKKEGFNIEVVGIPGGELADRLIAEKNNGVADLVYGLNNIEYNKLKKEDLLTKYKPKWADEVDLSLGDKDGYYYPIVVQPLVLIGKKDVKMPADWTDLTQSSYKGKYGIFALGGGTSKTVLASILVRYKDKDGDLGISDKGWDIAKKYIQNAYIYAQDENFATTLLDSEKNIDYSMVWGSGLLLAEKEHNYDFQVMSPKVGVPFVTEQTAVISSSKKKALAKEFINWFGSADIQAKWSEKFGSIPANTKALEKSPENVKTFADEVKPQKIDWEFVASNLDKWVEKVELEYVK
ncbi:extracellular solute-binding protein [Enterococcus cecorum]|uniref:extracellular solute-binding protein n=1 Tax=Enterococcus cecorum TaxID=44008 RepID=UPI002ACA65CB|nr:extracellular solute-binding protein [Enterococcus cecorum]MDZ5440728.1 extracellular solute-binding protein [Enterococcus cecorum]MDZ5497742.1 extracellular solute-binding protein [Enterococcus cecorum]MDZ5499876.1 extracellular solute-binding protein [Enterococcus cecorum]MDZ5562692.1 extracellular solute-binding protein [Enterococcus cecorum]